MSRPAQSLALLTLAAALVAGLVGCTLAPGGTETRREGKPSAPVLAEWPQQKMLYLSGPRPHHIRTMRADHGAYVILQDLALPVGTAVVGMQVDDARRELRVLTAQGVLALPITSGGQLVAENATVAAANLATIANEPPRVDKQFQ